MIFYNKIMQIDSNPHLYAVRILSNKIGDALRSHQSSREVSFERLGEDVTAPDGLFRREIAVALTAEAEFARDVETIDLITYSAGTKEAAEVWTDLLPECT